MQSVINASPEVHTAVEAAGAEHLLLDVPDLASSNLLQHLPRAVAFLSGALASRGRALVHCYEGVSRSVTVSLDAPAATLPACLPCSLHSLLVNSLRRCVSCGSDILSGQLQERDSIVAPLRQQSQGLLLSPSQHQLGLHLHCRLCWATSCGLSSWTWRQQWPRCMWSTPA